MKIYSCHTPSHDVLYDGLFEPSLPASLENHPNRLEIAGSGDFMTGDFVQTLEEKLGLVLASIAANRGGAILWSDVDIAFFDDPLPLLRDLLKWDRIDIWFQREHDAEPSDINAGFVLMRCNDAVEKLYRDAMAVMRATPGFNDQDAINTLLKGGADIAWEHLPIRFAARSQGWPPCRDLVMYHANLTLGADGVGQKLRQFRDLDRLRRYGPVYLRYQRLEKKLRRLGGKIRRVAGTGRA